MPGLWPGLPGWCWWFQEIFGGAAHIQESARRWAQAGLPGDCPQGLFERQGDVSGLALMFASILPVVSLVPDEQVARPTSDATVAWVGADGQGQRLQAGEHGFLAGGGITWLYCRPTIPGSRAGVAWYAA